MKTLLITRRMRRCLFSGSSMQHASRWVMGPAHLPICSYFLSSSPKSQHVSSPPNISHQRKTTEGGTRRRHSLLLVRWHRASPLVASPHPMASCLASILSPSLLVLSPDPFRRARPDQTLTIAPPPWTNRGQRCSNRRAPVLP
jgi:hypothetical protein